MDREQDAEVKKHRLNLAVFKKFKVEVDNVVQFKLAVVEYGVLFGLIDTAFNKQNQNLKGYAEMKSKYRTDAITDAVIISGLICVLAYKTNDLVLKASSNLYKTDFEIKDELCLALLKTVVENATTYKLDLVDYGLTDISYDAFITNVNGFGDNISITSEVIEERHAETLSLATYLLQADGLLDNVIEKLMDPFKKKNPKFFNEFTSANKNTVLGSHKKRVPKIILGSFTVMLADKFNVNPISFGLLKIIGSKIVYFYDEANNEVIKLPFGEYKGMATALGYMSGIFDVIVNKEEQTVLILLEPEVTKLINN
ncbi:MAG: hypothetical protein WCL51_02305 [Bacteroidota bacterium]